METPRVLESLGKHCLAAEVVPILEVVYLAMAADRRIRDEELDAFDAIAAYLHANVERPTDRPYREQAVRAGAVGVDVNELLTRFAECLDREGPGRRLRTASALLTRPAARDLAFQLSFVIVSSDLDTNDAESRWEDRTAHALAIPQDWANALVNEVLSANALVNEVLSAMSASE